MFFDCPPPEAATVYVVDYNIGQGDVWVPCPVDGNDTVYVRLPDLRRRDARALCDDLGGDLVNASGDLLCGPIPF